jgi:hypothetical protein
MTKEQRVNFVTSLMESVNAIEKARVEQESRGNYIVLGMSQIREMADERKISVDEMTEIIRNELNPYRNV